MLPGTPCCFARQDDAPEERLAVATVWPLARCALCCWHVFRNVETRYVRITGHRGDVVWTTIKSHLWTAAHAKQSRKGRLALVTALGTIFNILHKPRVLEYQPHDVVSAMLDAAQLGASQAAEKREASRTLASLGIEPGRKVHYTFAGCPIPHCPRTRSHTERLHIQSYGYVLRSCLTDEARGHGD